MAKRTDLSKMTEEQKAEHRRQKRREATQRYREKKKNDPEFNAKIVYSNKKSNTKAFIREATDEDFHETMQLIKDEAFIRFGEEIDFTGYKKEPEKEPEKPVEESKPLPSSPEEEIVEDFAESESVTLMSHLTQKTNKESLKKYFYKPSSSQEEYDLYSLLELLICSNRQLTALISELNSLSNEVNKAIVEYSAKLIE